MTRWSAHLGTLFGELPLLDRFGAAARAGFSAVDLWSPFQFSASEVTDAASEARVKVTSFNLDAGDMAAGDRGRLNDPMQREYVGANAYEAVEFARALGCQRVNALVGNLLPNQTRSEALAHVVEALRMLASIFEPHGVQVLVEPLNPKDNPSYLVTSAAEAIELIASTQRSGVGLLYDAYHAGMSGRSPQDEVRRYAESIRHVHVADWPGRHEPGTGDLDLQALLDALEETGYDGYVGLEFVPRGETLDGLAWLPVEQRGDEVRA